MWYAYYELYFISHESSCNLTNLNNSHMALEVIVHRSYCSKYFNAFCTWFCRFIPRRGGICTQKDSKLVQRGLHISNAHLLRRLWKFRETTQSIFIAFCLWLSWRKRRERKLHEIGSLGKKHMGFFQSI